MAKKDTAPKKEKTAPKGRTNMVSSRKDFDKVYAQAQQEGPEVAATVAKYFGILSQSMSKLGWEPKAPEVAPTETDTPADDTTFAPF